MIINNFKLNRDKTEAIIIISRYHPQPPLESLQVGNVTVAATSSACNLGVIFIFFIGVLKLRTMPYQIIILSLVIAYKEYSYS